MLIRVNEKLTEKINVLLTKSEEIAKIDIILEELHNISPYLDAKFYAGRAERLEAKKVRLQQELDA